MIDLLQGIESPENCYKNKFYDRFNRFKTAETIRTQPREKKFLYFFESFAELVLFRL